MTGSVFGTATITSDEIETALTKAGHQVQRPDPPETNLLTDESIDWLVVCTSSTGNGDIPDDLVPVLSLIHI